MFLRVAPLDLCGRKMNESTVCVGNLPCEATEEEIVELFNSVDGVYENRQPNIVIAANFAYDNGNFQGRACLLYSTIELANFVVERMHNRELRQKRLCVQISSSRFKLDSIGYRGYLVGGSRE